MNTNSLLITKSKCEQEILTEIKQQLYFARVKLERDYLPWQLRTTGYIRISYLNLRRYVRHVPEDRFNLTCKLSYLELLKILSAEDLQWWNKCKISSTGILESDERTLNLLLQPLGNFHAHMSDLLT